MLFFMNLQFNDKQEDDPAIFRSGCVFQTLCCCFYDFPTALVIVKVSDLF